MTQQQSSRQRTKETGRFVRDTPGSKSLNRGLLLLRAYRGGIWALTNSELATFTGLPRSTVSRLTRTLVDAGFLDFDIASGTYRLGPPFLTLGAGAKRSSDVLKLALPEMRKLADAHQVNVGLAVEDAGDMVYLDSVRRNQLGQFRRAIPGTRIPIAETAIGRAWLSTLSEDALAHAYEQFAERYAERWPQLKLSVSASIQEAHAHGWCDAEFRTGELTSIATPLTLSVGRTHIMNISFSSASGSNMLDLAQALVHASLKVSRQLVANVSRA